MPFEFAWIRFEGEGILQHTAIHCNTLRERAYCNTLQYTAIH